MKKNYTENLNTAVSRIEAAKLALGEKASNEAKADIISDIRAALEHEAVITAELAKYAEKAAKKAEAASELFAEAEKAEKAEAETIAKKAEIEAKAAKAASAYLLETAKAKAARLAEAEAAKRAKEEAERLAKQDSAEAREKAALEAKLAEYERRTAELAKDKAELAERLAKEEEKWTEKDGLEKAFRAAVDTRGQIEAAKAEEETEEARKEGQINNFFAADQKLRSDMSAFLASCMSDAVRNNRMKREIDAARRHCDADTSLMMEEADIIERRAKLAEEVETIREAYREAAEDAAKWDKSEEQKALAKALRFAETNTARKKAIIDFFAAYHMEVTEKFIEPFFDATRGSDLTKNLDFLERLGERKSLTAARKNVLTAVLGEIGTKMICVNALKVGDLPADIIREIKAKNAKKKAKK